MISISEAIRIIQHENCLLEAKTVDLEESIGRVLAQEIFADMDLPPFDRSQMDGFAVKTEDTKVVPVKLKIVGESVAGKGFDGKLKHGEAVRIMTGARLANGADAVQKVELTKESEGFVTILESVKEKQNVIKCAEEIRKGETIFEKGETVTENMIAPLAAFGYAKVKVFKKPEVVILATGSEIVDINQKPKQDQIRNSNSWAIKSLAEKCGAKVEILPLVKDDLENLKAQIAEAVGMKSKVQSPKSKTNNPKSKI
jgi:molybdopterin biosynthesis enzyme